MVETANKQIFVIVALRNPQAISAKIAETKLQHHSLKDDAWLVAYKGTTRELAESLEIRGGEIGASALVTAIESYSGRAPQEVWEWLKVNWPQNA